MEEAFKSKLLIVIRAAFGETTDSFQLSKEDVKSIERIAERQSVFYIIIVGLKKLGYKELLSEKAIQFIPKAAYDYVQREEALKEVSQTLNDVGISYILLKGAVLRKLYPQPYMRSCSDIDVLVHEESVDKAIDAIETCTSFKSYKRADHDIHFVNKRVHLELHFSLLANLNKLDKVLGKAWDYASWQSEGKGLAFTPEFQIFYITAHAAKHFIKEGGVGIRPLLDLWLLRSKTDYNEEQVSFLCDEAGILGFYTTCCDLLSVWFDGKDYSNVTKNFEDIVLSGGVFGSEHLRIVSRGRVNRSSRKYVWSRVVRSREDIKEFYPICKKYPILIPGYQIVRWSKMLRSANRKAARRELNQRREINQSEIDKYDQLLKSMGL